MFVYLLPLHFLLSLRFGHFLNTENETPSKKPMVVHITSHIYHKSGIEVRFYHRCVVRERGGMRRD